ncbi:TPA: hypothetical protein HA295_03080 [Candidatus Woesearchaeota archaeon]|nr:hypothetical protein [Candidatus Woesearchaeota archaeon]
MTQTSTQEMKCEPSRHWEDYFHDHYHEWAGLELGIKAGAIFYLPPGDVASFAAFLHKIGYHTSVSGFGYVYRAASVERVFNPPDGSRISVYVSKEKKTCNRLKYLDELHQLQRSEPRGLTGKEIFYELGGLLGYPRCCSSSLQDIYEKRLAQHEELASIDYSDETLYPMLALQRSRRVNHHLNNFSNHLRCLVSFYVCSYDCPHAESIAMRVLTFASQLHDAEKIEAQLKAPLLFVSPRETIFLPGARKKEGKVHYGSTLFKGENISQKSEEDAMRFRHLCASLEKGNSLEITDTAIAIFSDGTLISTFMKRHRYDGVFVEFD